MLRVNNNNQQTWQSMHHIMVMSRDCWGISNGFTICSTVQAIYEENVKASHYWHIAGQAPFGRYLKGCESSWKLRYLSGIFVMINISRSELWWLTWNKMKYIKCKFINDMSIILHIAAETKWTPFRRRHFQMHFLERKCLNSDESFTEICS